MYSSRDQSPSDSCADGLGGEGGVYLTCFNQKELTVKWIKRVKSVMVFWSKRDVLLFNFVMLKFECLMKTKRQHAC